MNNHKVYTDVEDNISYKVLSYINDNPKNKIYVDKFIKENKYCKVIKTKMD